MSPISHLLILFFVFFSPLTVAVADQSNANNPKQESDANNEEKEFVRLDLIHRHHPEVVKRLHDEIKVDKMEDRIKDIRYHDQSRLRAISVHMNWTKVVENAEEKEKKEASSSNLPPQSQTPIALKTYPGADFGSSEFFVQLKLGTPPQKFTMIADTGSDLLWTRCRYRRCRGDCSNPSPIHKMRNRMRERFIYALYANQSSSFSPIPCSSKQCIQDFSELGGQPDCPTPNSPCSYTYSYLSGDRAMGIFATETVTVRLTNGKEKQLKDILYGCTEEITDSQFLDGADGLIGLGSSIYSFVYKAAENNVGGGFSYCLADHLRNITAISYFVFGTPSPKTFAASTSSPIGPPATTRLITGGRYSCYYGVQLAGISVDGQILNIPPHVWNIKSGCGTILDTGTSLTMLTAPAHDAVIEAMAPKIEKFGRMERDVKGEREKNFKLCFNDTQWNFGMLPKLGFHFEGGAVFEPPDRSYIVSASYQCSCIAITSLPFPSINILGNIIQQTYLWQFDLLKGSVTFAPSDCA
ncbi:aspartic proteinase NANA, chloroplast-like [Cucurbita moschata]|uniref:Aspartic proteinase NANA, chloroplast-like n=1 Tax=Cucurbita moschata TaxID=3662 RepID=A0A6J1G810_CUCMO|nr:aspartic proteinase NANA, chloroplast-like [Cucurbita moschata]